MTSPRTRLCGGCAGHDQPAYPPLRRLADVPPPRTPQVEQIKYKNLDMSVWDVGGQDKIRPLWRHYYENSDAVIYVVDSNDTDRLSEARDELHKMMNDELLRHARLLVLANKQDLPHAVRPDKIVDALGLPSLRCHEWFIQPCSAARGEGLFEGLDWLSRSLKNVARAA